MKIKKVDDKPMVIHTKKKMNIHKAEAVKDMKSKEKVYDNEASAKGRWSFIKSFRDSKSSIKTKAVSLKVATTAAGSAAGPYGMLIGAAAGAVVGEKIDVMDHKATMRMRKLKYFRNKMQAQENQTDSIGKLVKDIFLGNMKFVMKKVMLRLRLRLLQTW